MLTAARVTELLSLAEDGQHMFLHPVNVRCLVREYGSLEQSPEKISATVVEIAGYSMSEVRLCGKEQHVALT